MQYIPRIGNGLVWTVSVDDGNILCDAVGDIALEIVLGEKYALGVASDAMAHVLYSIKREREKTTRIRIHVENIYIYSNGVCSTRAGATTTITASLLCPYGIRQLLVYSKFTATRVRICSAT